MADQQHHVIQPRTYLIVFALLIVLTVTTVGIDIARVNLGAWHNTISMLIAVAKASLVILFFMHVWYSQPLTWVVALSGLLWLAILLTYTLTDYISRGWNGVPGH